MNKTDAQAGLTLIEILLVMIIFAILAGLISSFTLSSLKRGYDQKRKSDLAMVAKALDSYHSDSNFYPSPFLTPVPILTGLNSFNSQLCYPTGEPGCQKKIYMLKLPTDPNQANNYVYLSDGNSYRLFSCLENTNDVSAGVNQSGFQLNQGADDLNTVVPCGACGHCKYSVSSVNITPIP